MADKFLLILFWLSTIKSSFSSPTLTTLRVSMVVFSGTRDPVWNIDPTNANYSVILNYMLDHSSTPLGGQLGYNGFKLESNYGAFSINPSYTMFVGRCEDPTFEKMLVNTVHPLIPIGYTKPLADNVVQYAENEITSCQ